MITIKEFTSQAEAAMVQSYLLDCEIDAILIDEYSAAYTGALIPIRLQVPTDQAETALSFIAEFEASPAIMDEADISNDTNTA